MDYCLHHFLGKSIQTAIKCYIHVDIAHIIKMITKWKCFNDKVPRIKDFYVRCIGLMTTCKYRFKKNDVSRSYSLFK